MRTAMLLLLCLLPTSVVRAEFVVKYFIDGHVFAPAGGGPVISNQAPNWIADLDGDGAPEALVFGNYEGYQSPVYHRIGITRLLSGETQWFDIALSGACPMQAADCDGRAIEAPPTLYDVDADHFLDVLVPVQAIGSGFPRTVVIGWIGTAAVGNQDAPLLPQALSESRPNPTAGSVSISFELPGRSRVQLAIYDVSGRLVSLLADGILAGGGYSIPWDVKDDNGQAVTSGSYFYQLTVDGREESKRMVVVR